MKPFKALILLHFKMLLFNLGGFTRRKKSKKNFSLLGGFVFLTGVLLFVSGTYSFGLAQIFAAAGHADLIIVLMALMTILVCYVLTAFNSQGILFAGKDIDIIFSLPVSTFQVILSKVLAIYLENILFALVLILPAIYAYFYYTAFSLVSFCLLLASIPILSLLPLSLTIITSFIMNFISTRFKHKNLITSVLAFVFFGGYIIFSFRINVFFEQFFSNPSLIKDALSRYFPPVMWMQEAFVNGNILSFLLFALSVLAPFFLITYILSVFYHGIVSKNLSHHITYKYKMKSLATSSTFFALLKKEARRFFGTPMYLINMGFGTVILFLAGGALFFFRDAILEVVVLVPEISFLIPALLTAFAIFSLSTCAITAVSISLEGNRLWILKESPVSTLSVFGAKVLVQLIVTVLPALFFVVVSSLAFSLSALDFILIMLPCAAFCVFSSLLGLVANLLFPKLDYLNENMVIKQSGSVLIVMLGSMLTVALGCFAYIKWLILIPYFIFSFSLTGILLILSALLWLYLVKKGQERFAAL